MRKRDTDYTYNSFILVFLRKLEYYQGVILLTTNQVRDFNNTIRSRIHLTLRYNSLGVNIRKGIWDTFLKSVITAKGNVDYSEENLKNLVKYDLNSRQVGNISENL